MLMSREVGSLQPPRVCHGGFELGRRSGLCCFSRDCCRLPAKVSWCDDAAQPLRVVGGIDSLIRLLFIMGWEVSGSSGSSPSHCIFEWCEGLACGAQEMNLNLVLRMLMRHCS